MPTIKFPFYIFSEKELRNFEKEGFMPGWKDNTDYLIEFEPTEVTDPQGKKWNLDKCVDVLLKKLEFGNREQIRTIKALDYFNYLFQVRRIKADFGDEL